ncbi:DUF3040 domain-containing protein [Dactylosporangium sp. CA-092794]|uniref:DUF3040 domain-containing protein n=1 Tax=Dactylosporangium sp. CA-092794 TaxID=3239929 RepID=UPI003D8C9F75
MNDEERRALHRLELELEQNDPQLSYAMSHMSPVRRWRRTAALWTTASGSCGIPAGILADNAALMLVGLCVLSIGAGLWHPVD